MSLRVEEIVLQYGGRGMNRLRSAMRPGYCLRAAEHFLARRGVVLIGTGFPVAGTFESDGPLGAIALYRVLEHLGSIPVFACGPPISRVLGRRFALREMPLNDPKPSREMVLETLKELTPSLAVSVERPGITADGRYYNMLHEDITPLTAKFDLFFELCNCPRIAFGDGGNEVGMGNVKEALSGLNIRPSVTPCDELVIATVSNWGVYGVIALMGCLMNEDLLTLFDPEDILDYLTVNGCVDGITKRLDRTEDGFPMNVGSRIIGQLRELVPPSKMPSSR